MSDDRFFEHVRQVMNTVIEQVTDASMSDSARTQMVLAAFLAATAPSTKAAVLAGATSGVFMINRAEFAAACKEFDANLRIEREGIVFRATANAAGEFETFEMESRKQEMRH